MTYQNRTFWQLPLVTLVVLLFCTISILPAQTVPEIAEKALASTVYLEMQDSNGLPLGVGSGFFVLENLIATNYHVIKEAMRGTAKLVGKSTIYTIEGVTAVDKANDLVILKVTASGIKSLPLGNSDVVRIGEAVYVAGNPKGLEGTFSNGIISSLREKSITERLQMTAPISPGSSGGPVLNNKGEVIGVSVMTLVGGQNLNFAIPVNILKALLEQSSTAMPFTHVDPVRFAEVYLRWGKEKYKLGNYENAIADYDIAIQLNPDHADIYNNRGNAKHQLGRYDAAITDYDIAIQLNPDHADIYNNRGNAKHQLGRYDAAITDYDTAIQLKPNYAEAYNKRGRAKHKLGRYDAAITDYDTAIQLKPNHAEVYINRGDAKHQLGQYDASIADYDIAIQLNPIGAAAYSNRGRAKHKLGWYDAAITDYDTAIRLKPNYAYTYIRRGFVKEKLGQPSAAIADYDIAVRLKPDYAFTYYNRGSVKALLNRTSEARQDLRTALRLAVKTGDKSLKAKIEKALRSLE